MTDIENPKKEMKQETGLDAEGQDTLEAAEEAMDATWGEVLQSCCTHTPEEWGYIFLGTCAALTFLFFFLVGLDLLGNAAKVMTACSAGALFGDDTNPIGGLMVGIMVTVLLQSSSTTTSIVVSLVGAGTVTVDQGIYMIMGANIGTSVTSTIVAMGQLGDGDQLERAFAGATVHDMFNFLTVGVLLPVEVITGYLDRLTGAMVKNANPEDGESWDTPLDKLIDPIVKRILDDNSGVVKHVAKGGSCDDYYPIVCEDRVVSDSTCKEGLIACYKDADVCPLFFDQDATKEQDITSGGVAFGLAIILMFICLAGLVYVLKKMLLGVSTRIIYKATDLNAYLAMVVGCGITMFVQSSSITTSVLTPLVGVGVLRLEGMLPLTLGANIGTTVTALLAALVSASVDSLQVALAHLLFNITGIIIWFPLPFMRRIPLAAARNLGKATRIWRGFPLVYILVCFLLIPLFFFGLSSLYMGSAGLVALGVVLTVMLAIALAYTAYWFYKCDGKAKTIAAFEARQRKNDLMKTLPENMGGMNSEIEILKRQVQALMDHTGAPEIEVEDVVGDAGEFEKDQLIKTDVEAGTDDDDEDIVNEIQT